MTANYHLVEHLKKSKMMKMGKLQTEEPNSEVENSLDLVWKCSSTRKG